MKKIISSFFSAALLLPLTAISVLCEVGARNFGILPPWEGIVDISTVLFMSGIIIITGLPIYWLANILLRWFEKLPNPGFNDHLRQSAFLYLIILYSIATWLFRGYSGSEEDGYLLLWSGYSLIAIALNQFFIRYKYEVIKPNKKS